MPELKISGWSDDCVEFEGAILDEFYIDYSSREWVGWLQSPDGGMARVYLSYCKQNPEGWWVELRDSSWDYRVVELFNDSERGYGDPVLYVDVPEGTMIEEEK